MEFESALSSIGETLTTWGNEFVDLLPRIAVAILVVVGGWLLARVARRVVVRLMQRATAYKPVVDIVATTSYLMVLAIATFAALSIVGLDKAVTSLLAGAGIIGLALGFAFQDIAANFISGIMMTVRRPFRPGDILESNDFMGTVQHLNLRATVLRTFEGQAVLIPNKEIYKKPLVNYSTTGKRRVDLSCGVAYGDDLGKAERIALEAIRSVERVDSSRDVDLYFTEFGDSSINFTVRFWITFEKQTDFLSARSEAIKKLKKAFDAEGITIPFPIRTVDFGVVGGQPLAEALPEWLSDRRIDNGSKTHA